MMWVFLLLGLAATVVSTEIERDFSSDRNLIEEETGGRLRLHSRGKLSEIIDLDKTECVHVRRTCNTFSEFVFKAILMLNF